MKSMDEPPLGDAAFGHKHHISKSCLIRAFLCSWRDKNKLGFLPFSVVAK
jgi:hypothetical protein